MLRFRMQRSNPVTLPISLEVAHSLLRGHQQAGSLAGAAPCRKDICRA